MTVPATGRSVAVAAAQETSARTFRSCGTSAAAEMRSIPCRAEIAKSSCYRAPIVKMNLRNRSTGTGSLLFLGFDTLSANKLTIILALLR